MSKVQLLKFGVTISRVPNLETPTVEIAGRPATSDEIFRIVNELEWFASYVKGQEAAKTLTVGQHYYFRGKRGTSYVVVTRIDGNKVFTKAANREGQIIAGSKSGDESQEFPFYEPQRLTAFKLKSSRP